MPGPKQVANRAPRQLLRTQNFSSYAEAVSRTTFTPDDAPMYLPRLDIAHMALDDYMERGSVGGSVGRREQYRMGSVAASRPQTDFYARLAGSPAIRTICEVGFNAGHSTAIWLASNPTGVVRSFK